MYAFLAYHTPKLPTLDCWMQMSDAEIAQWRFEFADAPRKAARDLGSAVLVLLGCAVLFSLAFVVV